MKSSSSFAKMFAGVSKMVASLALVAVVGFTAGCDPNSGDDTENPPYAPQTFEIPSSNTSMPDLGTLSSEFADSPYTQGLRQLVDNIHTTSFVTPHSSFYVIWNGNSSAVVNYYYLISAKDSPDKDPKSWALYGSTNSGLSWTLLDERTDEVFESRRLMKEYEFDNSTAYDCIKLEITENNGGASTQIAEFSMAPVPVDINDLMGRASGYTNSPVTPMGNHYANAAMSPTTAEQRANLADISFEPDFAAQTDGLSSKAYGVTLYPSGEPSPRDCNQHAVGDCCAIAVFASFAYLYPDFIKDIITQNSAGSFTVKMFDPQGLPVDVTVSNRFADGAVTGKGGEACWSTVLEKAIMKWNKVYGVNYNIGGIGTEHVAPLFTGNGDSFSFARAKEAGTNGLTAEELGRAGTVSIRNGMIVVGGYGNEGGVKIPGTNLESVGGHAFTIMHPINSSYIFAMRNPWGANQIAAGGGYDSSNDGVAQIPFDYDFARIIDLRIVYPSDEMVQKYGKGKKDPYIPTRAAGSDKIWVSPELLRTGM